MGGYGFLFELTSLIVLLHDRLQTPATPELPDTLLICLLMKFGS